MKMVHKITYSNLVKQFVNSVQVNGSFCQNHCNKILNFISEYKKTYKRQTIVNWNILKKLNTPKAIISHGKKSTKSLKC